MTRTEPVISIKHLNHYYGKGTLKRQILFDINFDVYPGEIVIMTGPSGSGKTTLLSLIGGLRSVQEGSLQLLSQELYRANQKKLVNIRRNIGFIFQGFNLFPALTALENVEVALNIKGIRKHAATKQARLLLEQVGLAEKANQLPRDLSGGQKQRVAIARALGGEPKLIMADEPTAALDSHNGYAVIELLHRLAKEQNRTVLMVTHDPRIVDFADCVVKLEDGTVKEKAFWSITCLCSTDLKSEAV